MPEHTGGHPAPAQHSPAPAAAAQQVAISSAAIISDATREEIKKGHWGHFFKLVAVDLGLFGAVLGLTALYGRLRTTKEHEETINKARKHAQEGNIGEAMKTLQGLPFGLGLFDEQIIDKALQLAREKQFAKEDKLRQLEQFLAQSPRYRFKFRLALALPDSDENRARLVADYANMNNDEERKTRLMAVGKLDPSPAKEIAPKAMAVAKAITDPDNNGLKALNNKMSGSLFVKAAKFLVK